MIKKSKDCGNSPKQQFLQDLTIALACNHLSELESFLSQDISWCQSGRADIVGMDTLINKLKKNPPADSLTIHDVVSHGKKGAVRGMYENSGKARSFCHFFEFTNHKYTEVHVIHTMSTPLKSA